MQATERRTRARKTYTGDALRAIAMPMGGIGTGTIALAGDGSLRQWQIHNQVNHLACVPHSFFAIWGRKKRTSSPTFARVLQSDALYDTEGPAPPSTSNDHVVPIPHRRLMSKQPGVNRIEFTGGYPIAELRYEIDDIPLEITMESFSPFVPLNADDSGIPAICFNITVTNPTDEAWHASIAGSLQNAVGWDGVAPIFDTRCQLYRGNANSLTRTGAATAISMATSHLPEDADGYGTMSLAVEADDATWLTQWSDLTAFWDDFAADGRFANLNDSTPSSPGRTWNGALAAPFTLQPGESRTVPFRIAWYFPNHYVNWDQAEFLQFKDTKSKLWLGNKYNTRFRSALDVIDYVAANGERLTRETRLARDTFYDTTLPGSLIESVTSQMSVIRSPTCFWTEDGGFYGFEGCNGASTNHHNEPVGGCCPLNCTHVWNYEMSLSRLFPGLERHMRHTEWDIQQGPDGSLPHRVLLPAYLPRNHSGVIGAPDHPAIDGLLGAVLKTYREFRADGDHAWLLQTWPSVKMAIDHIWTSHDPERTGVIKGEQPNTYDISIYGANSFIGTIYLASLRATEEIARALGDHDLAAECRSVFERGRATLEARIWNGEYYFQEVDLTRHPEQNWASGCHTDHLMGQWWAHYLDLGHLLDPEHLKTAAESIVRHNFRNTFRERNPHIREYVTDDDQGLVICSWPRGGRPAVPTLYSDEVWSGLEYEVAALLLYEGKTERAMQILNATRARYDGVRLNPWNDIECGDHYVRAMSSWSLLEAASGFRYNAAKAELGFAPAFTDTPFSAPFVARDGWGTFSQNPEDDESIASVSIAWGALNLASLTVETSHDHLAAELGHLPLDIDVTRDGTSTTITFTEAIEVRPGAPLQIGIGRA